MFDTKKVADTYDQIALNFSATRRKLSPEVISLLPALPKNASVLDLGCGNGVLLTAFDRRSLGEGGSVDYLGLDISPVLIKEASRLHPEGRFTVADITAERTWAALHQFDFVAALAVFHHLPSSDDHIKLLQSIKQHLKKNGVCLVSVWNLNRPKFARHQHPDNPRLFSIPFHPARNASSIADAGGGAPKRDFYVFEPDELPSLAKQIGFTIMIPHQKGENLYLRLD